MKAVLQRSRKNSLKQARATTRACVADQPPPCTWTQTWSKEQISSRLLSAFTTLTCFHFTDTRQPQPLGSLSQNMNLKSQLDEAVGRVLQRWNKYRSKRPIPLFMKQECSSANATFSHISCEWHHPNATWETSVTFLIPPAQSFNPSNHSLAVDLTSESFFDSSLSIFQ